MNQQYKETATSLNLTTLLTHSSSEIREIGKLILDFKKEMPIKLIEWNYGKYFQIQLLKGILTIDLSHDIELHFIDIKQNPAVRTINLASLKYILENERYLI